MFKRIKTDFKKIYDISEVLNNINFISDEKLEGTLSIKDNILNPDNWIVGKY